MPDRDGAECLIFVVKATYLVGPGGRLEPAEEQNPVVLADEYFGEPGESGIVRASEVLPPAPTTGVTVSGHAVAPQRGVQRMQVGVSVGGMSVTAIVYGDRRWKKKLGGAKPDLPEPIERIPLVWDHAFGGTDLTPGNEKQHQRCEANPVGRGFVARAAKPDIAEMLLPNIEHPNHPIKSPRDRPPPVGFSPIAPNWPPRVDYAGTYDDAWMSERCPLLPDDFDERFFQAAPAPLTANAYLAGGESCTVTGMSEEGTYSFPLPREKPAVRLRFARGAINATPVLERVHIDADRKAVEMLFKVYRNIHGKVESLAAVEVGLG